jgi:hypothetical protein
VSNTQGTGNNIYIGCVYTPPEHSSFGKENTGVIWDKLENDVEFFSTKGSVLLYADFNARTGNLQDCTQDYFDEYESLLFNKMNIRTSTDCLIQKNGRRLIQLCTDNNICILNGRTLGDFQGKATCIEEKGCSVVDYFLCSYELFKYVSKMCVQPLTVYSDQCALLLVINLNIHKNVPVFNITNGNRDQQNVCDIKTNFKWDSSSSEKFAKAITDSRIEFIN